MNKLTRTHKCKKCKKYYFVTGKEDYPVMLGFQTNKGTVNLCYNCICELGKMEIEDIDKWLEEN